MDIGLSIIFVPVIVSDLCQAVLKSDLSDWQNCPVNFSLQWNLFHPFIKVNSVCYIYFPGMSGNCSHEPQSSSFCIFDNQINGSS